MCETINHLLCGWCNKFVIQKNHLSAKIELFRLLFNERKGDFCIGMLGDLIFLTSVLCMKDSWRAGIPDKDRTELVTSGIYRYSRNPAFLGFDFMYAGLLLMYYHKTCSVETIIDISKYLFAKFVCFKHMSELKQSSCIRHLLFIEIYMHK